MPHTLIRRSLAALFAASLMTGAASAEDRALLVGVNSYPFLLENGQKANKDLRGPVPDSRNMAAFLQDTLGFRPEQIRVLNDADAKREDILANFQSWLIEGTGPGDRAFFYFSGHGLSAEDKTGDEEDGLDEMIAPHDVSGDLAQGELSNVITDDEISGLLTRLQGRAVTLISDSCFSGTISRSIPSADDPPRQFGAARTLSPRGPLNVRLTEDQRRHNKTESRLLAVLPPDGGNGSSQIVWTAASASQLAWDRPDGKGGIFTSAFIDAASGAGDRNRDGKTTAAEILDFTRGASEKYCASNNECLKFGLTPTLEAAPADRLQLPLFGTPVAAEAPAAPQPAVVADDLLAHGNDFGLDLAIEPGTDLDYGQELKIRITSEAGGRLFLFDQSAGGDLVQIFPNARAQDAGKDGRLRRGATLTIPDESYGLAFTATERGAGALLAVVVEGDIGISDLVSADKGFDIVKAPQAFVIRLGERLRQPKLDAAEDVPNGRYRWSYARLDYMVK
jgi:metacaspase-1